MSSASSRALNAKTTNVQMKFVCFQDSSGLQENIFHRLVALKMEKTWYFSDIFLARKKKHFTKSPHIKVLLVNKLWFWWVRYHLRTVIRNPRRHVELTMGRIKCKQSLVILHSTIKRASRCAFYNSIHGTILSRVRPSARLP